MKVYSESFPSYLVFFRNCSSETSLQNLCDLQKLFCVQKVFFRNSTLHPDYMNGLGCAAGSGWWRAGEWVGWAGLLTSCRRSTSGLLCDLFDSQYPTDSRCCGNFMITIMFAKDHNIREASTKGRALQRLGSKQWCLQQAICLASNLLAMLILFRPTQSD